MWDVFISHAAEDKDSVARPLAEALGAAGLRVWFDEFALSIGDSLNRSIDRGLAGSRYGVVILSPHFIAKEWPRRELDGLTVREISLGKVILPVWHGVTREQVERFSPVLADRVGISTERGIPAVAQAIVQALAPPGVAPLDAAPGPAPAQVPPQPARRRVVQGLTLLSGAGLGWAGWTQWQRRPAAAVADPLKAQAGDDAAASPGGQASRTPSGSAAGSSPPIAAPMAELIAGIWVIDATPSTPRTYVELQVVDGQLRGSTEMLFSGHPDVVFSGLAAQRKTAISEGRLGATSIGFTTRRRYRRELGNPASAAELVHRYEGRPDGKVLRLAVQIEGGGLEDVVARRPPPAGAARLLNTLRGHEGSINQLTLLPDGRLASASRDSTVRLWSSADGGVERTLVGPTQMQAVLALPEGQLLSADADGHLQVWDAGSGKPLHRFSMEGGLLQTALRLANGRAVVAWSHGDITVHELPGGRLLRRRRLDDRQAVALAEVAGGGLATGDADGNVRLWTLDKDAAPTLLHAGKPNTGQGMNGLLALPDGRLVCALPNEPQAWLLEPETRRTSSFVPGRPASWFTWHAVVGTEALVENSHGELMLWRPSNGASRVLLYTDRDEHAITAALALPDARLALGMGNGDIRVWKLA